MHKHVAWDDAKLIVRELASRPVMLGEINNALQPLVGTIGMLADQIAESRPKLAEHARVVERDVTHVRGIVQRMLALARGDDSINRPLDVHELVSETIEFVQHVMPSAVRIRHAKPEGPPVPAAAHVLADRDGFIQAVHNLAANAAHALGDRGDIEIRLSRPEPGRIEIAVSDHGPGMDEETLRHARDAFHSSKSPASGSGLARISHERSCIGA